MTGQVDWPRFHFDSGSDGVSPETLLSTANLSQLGVSWMQYTATASSVSPIVAYDAALNRTLVYIANYTGDMFAYDANSGQEVWATHLGVSTESSPLITGGTVWEGTSGGIFALDASTGAIQCRDVSLPGPVLSSPTDGVVNGTNEVFFTTLDSGPNWGEMLALGAGCVSGQVNVLWSFSGWGTSPGSGTPLGSWSPPSFGVDANGTPLVFTGTAEPDSAVYAVDATSGKLVWRFATPTNGIVDCDVGAGTTVSAPGRNGFQDGALYVPAKDGDLFALDLTTGTELWAFPFIKNSKSRGGGISTAALDGDNLYFGYGAGVYDVNAVTGSPVWKTQDLGLNMSEVDASPAVTGPGGGRVVLAADKSGVVRGFASSTGQQLWSYATSGPVYSSPAVSGGSVYIASNDGFLYDFAAAGATGAAPTTSVTNPSIGAQLANPDGVVTISGSASASAPIGRVSVGIQEYGAGGPWWNPGSKTWSPTPTFTAATLASPGETSSGWQYVFAVPATGGVFVLIADAVRQDGLADPSPPHTPFAVLAVTRGPQVAISSPSAAPGASITASGAGFTPSTSVSIALDATTLFSKTSDAAGKLSPFVVKLSAKELPGPHSLWATDSAGDATQSIVNVSTPWPQWRSGPSGTGAVTHTQPLNEGNMWQVLEAWATPTGAAVESSAAISGGTAYVGSDDGTLYALNIALGSVRWSVATGGPVKSSPAVTTSSVIFGSEDGYVRALDPGTGTLLWKTNLGTAIDSSPTLSGGTVFIGGADGAVRALNAGTGAVLWAAATGAAVTSSAAVDAGRVFIGSGDGAVYAYDAGTGSLVWRHVTGGPVSSSPAVTGGTVFIGSSDGSLYALAEPTGAVVWRYATGGAVRSSPAVGGGMVFFGSDDQTIYAVKQTGGALVWTRHAGGAISSSPVYAGSFVAYGSADGKVYATRSGFGWPTTTFTTGGAVSSSVSTSDGALYVGSGDGSEHAFTLFGAPPVIP